MSRSLSICLSRPGNASSLRRDEFRSAMRSRRISHARTHRDIGCGRDAPHRLLKLREARVINALRRVALPLRYRFAR